MNEEFYLTQSGYEELVKELEYLKTKRRRQIAVEIEKARAFGDISENAEYEAAKDAQGNNERRIAELESKLSRARIIEHENMPSDEVLIGATVFIRDMDTLEEFSYILVSDLEADYSQGKISIASPVGRGLLNRKIDEEFQIKIPAGLLKYKIIRISR